MARLAQSMGVSGLRQAIERDLRRAYGPCLKQLRYSIEVSRRQDPANRRTSRLPARHIVQLKQPSSGSSLCDRKLMAGRARFAARSKRTSDDFQ
jgi:hypothetical protein